MIPIQNHYAVHFSSSVFSELKTNIDDSQMRRILLLCVAILMSACGGNDVPYESGCSQLDADGMVSASAMEIATTTEPTSFLALLKFAMVWTTTAIYLLSKIACPVKYVIGTAMEIRRRVRIRV